MNDYFEPALDPYEPLSRIALRRSGKLRPLNDGQPPTVLTDLIGVLLSTAKGRTTSVLGPTS